MCVAESWLRRFVFIYLFFFLSGDGGTAAVRAEDQRSDASGAADRAGGHHRVPEGSGGDRSHTPLNVSPAQTFQLRRVVALGQTHRFQPKSKPSECFDDQRLRPWFGLSAGLPVTCRGPSSAQTRLSVAQDTFDRPSPPCTPQWGWFGLWAISQNP